jgi:ketosteroid isomerase-like protein
MMNTEMETKVREAYAAFGRGDLPGYLSVCTPDFAFHVPGRGAIAGTFRGAEGMADLAGRAMTATAGTFREDVQDVLTSAHHVVVLASHAFTRGERSWTYNTAHVYRVRDEQLAECWEQPRDLDEFDAAWALGAGVSHA